MVRIATAWVRETLLNFQFEMLSFIAHRVTGLGIVFFIFMHLLSLGGRLIGPDTYNKTMLLYDQWYFHIGEWMLFICCVFHCFNGLRIIAVDFFDLTRAQKALLFWSVGITAVLAGFAALFFFPALRQMIFIS